MQKVVIELVDDTDGSTATETVNFALDGVEYEIDLNNMNAGRLREGLATFVKHGRRIGGKKSGKGKAKGKTVLKPSPRDLRVWADANGVKVSKRGRVSEEVFEAYAAAHPNG